MDQLLDQARAIYEGEIDFRGQRLAEFLAYALLTVTGIVAFLAGFVSQDIYQTLYIGAGGTALTVLLVVPPWPVYNKNPQKWLPARSGSGGIEGVSIEVDGKRVS